MLPDYVYHPAWFYFITISSSAIICALAIYMSRIGLSQAQMPLLLLGICLPCITALVMIFGSHNEALISDFWQRLMLFSISPGYLLMILFLMPAIVCLATELSLFFGYSTDQFSLSKEFSIMKGWPILGIAVPLLLAPLIEELGWRGYGVDSLRAYFNFFTTSLLFSFFWAVWHIPAFFIKGYYHNQLWYQNKIYVLNFFASIFVIPFLMNWVYYKTQRSIPALVLFHGVLNFSMMVLNTEQFTKCIVTVLLAVVSGIVMLWDSHFVFRN